MKLIHKKIVSPIKKAFVVASIGMSVVGCASNYLQEVSVAKEMTDPDRQEAALEAINTTNEREGLDLATLKALNTLQFDTHVFTQKVTPLISLVSQKSLNETTDGQQALAYLADRNIEISRTVKGKVDPVCSAVSIQDIDLESSSFRKAEQLMSESCWFIINGQQSAADNSYFRAQAFYREAALEQVIPTYVFESKPFVPQPIYVMAARLCVDISDFCL